MIRWQSGGWKPERAAAPLPTASFFSVPTALSPPATPGSPTASHPVLAVSGRTGVLVSAPGWRRFRGHPGRPGCQSPTGAVQLRPERLRGRRARCFCRQPLFTCAAAVWGCPLCWTPTLCRAFGEQSAPPVGAHLIPPARLRGKGCYVINSRGNRHREGKSLSQDCTAWKGEPRGEGRQVCSGA